ncbi:hypothetical protein OAJ75_05020 [Candidatus Pelagibacter sp.]|nr:hypothetical protein [Candidatus Pelagibacter sp.]
MNFLKIIIILLLFQSKAYALIEVDITRGNLSPLPIAVSPLSSDNKSLSEFKKTLKVEDIGLEISKVVENNLKQSGLFNPLDKNAFLQNSDIAHLKPRFEDWKLIKAQALITGKVEMIDENLRVEFRLWDILAAKEMLAIAFTTVPTNWRRVGHIISDKVYERLTGEKGYFDTRIIYVAEEGPKTKRIKKLAIMDQDGFNLKYLTLGNELVLTPRFNPTSQMVTYLSYFRNLPRVYLLDIETCLTSSLIFSGFCFFSSIFFTFSNFSLGKGTAFGFSLLIFFGGACSETILSFSFFFTFSIIFFALGANGIFVLSLI